MRRFFLFLAVACSSILLIVFLSFPTTMWKDIFIMPFYRGMETIRLTVSPGQSVRSIAESLVSSGIAVDRDNLIRFMVRSGLDRKVQPGEYSLRRGPSWRIVSQMEETPPERFVVTIIPGTMLEDFFPKSPDISVDGISALSDDELFPDDMVKLLPKDAAFRAAYLLPETYHLPDRDPRSLIVQSSREWWLKLGKSVDVSCDLLEKATVASLVEMESLRDDERAKIAGVIFNRLRKNMPLQIDATVVYSWKKMGKDLRRVTYEDLKVDSKYNTYRIKGLPPGPICIPSLASWRAALAPEDHRYLYYVADGTGGHVFSVSYEEHRKAIRSIRGK